MPRYIIKPNQDRDEYVHWSTIVDGPITGVMSREEMKNRLLRGDKLSRPETEREAEISLTRADDKGHSLIGWEHSGWGKTEMVQLMRESGSSFGHIAHEDIADLARAAAASDWDAVERLVEVEDDE